jgi:hypothetical protein
MYCVCLVFQKKKEDTTAATKVDGILYNLYVFEKKNLIRNVKA